MSTQVIWKYFLKKCPNKVDFTDIIFNVSKFLCVLPLTLYMTGQLWLSLFIWHQDIKVFHCQYIAMSFIFTQYSFCNSFRQGLLAIWLCYTQMFIINICQPICKSGILSVIIGCISEY